jgi:lysozyme
MAVNEKLLFDTFREILGRGFTQDEVNRINKALMGEVVQALRKGMRPSATCIDFIHSFEQLRLTAYKDPGSANGLPITNGWGSTRDLEGKPIKLGAVWTEAYADAVFIRDLEEFTVGLNLLLQSKPTTQAQFDAMFSFAYNCGLDIDDDTTAEGLGDSSLLRKHLAGDYAGAKAEFAKWNKNDGKVLNGLTRRRAAEAAMYLP